MVGSVLSGVKISAAVSTSSARTSNGTSTVYTVPAECFLVCSIHLSSQPDGGGTVAHSLLIGGETIGVLNVTGAHIFSGTTTGTSGTNHQTPIPHTFFVGPGETIQHTLTLAGTGSATVKVVGTLFINTP